MTFQIDSAGLDVLEEVLIGAAFEGLVHRLGRLRGVGHHVPDVGSEPHETATAGRP